MPSLCNTLSSIMIKSSLKKKMKCAKLIPLYWKIQSDTPFTKASPNYPHKNYVDNSVKIAFTNSGHSKIIHFFYKRPLKKNLEKTDEREGKSWPLTAPLKLSALFWNCVHKFRVWSRCGYYADNCSIEKVRRILVPFRFYNQLMRILSALLNLWMGYEIELFSMMHRSISIALRLLLNCYKKNVK